MNLVLEYCMSKYYIEYDSEALLDKIQKSIDPQITNLCKEFQFIFHKMLYNDPCLYWNKDVYVQTSSLLESLFQNFGNNLEIDEPIFNYFLMGYNSDCQISDIIADLRNFNLPHDIKTRLYRIPTYTTLLEGCLSNFLRVIAILTGKGIGKDYSTQNSLGNLINNVMSPNGNNEISKNVDVNLRNAINHGKVLMKKTPGNRICFSYVENHIAKCKEMSEYDFDDIINNTFDLVSAVLLSLSKFMNNHITIIKIDEFKKTYESFSLLAMRISMPGICCHNISDTGNLKQLNVEIEVENTDRAYMTQIAIMLSIIVYEKYNDYEQYMFNFSNPRMANSWIRFKNREVQEMSNNAESFNNIIIEAIKREDVVIFDPSTEDVDLNEIKYFCFPNYNSELFIINNVEDASLEQRKRLKAHMYIGEITEKQEILEIIYQAINWLKTLKNPPSATIPQKHGNMEADSLYINVYKYDTRKNKELFPNNENFVCFVDYNLSGNTTLVCGGLLQSLWKQFHHEKIDKINIAWREGKYAVRKVKKVGRNELCPCGSGKKYKKCCGQ